jgi:tetratricopeptide (TPR) repeat protein
MDWRVPVRTVTAQLLRASMLALLFPACLTAFCQPAQHSSAAMEEEFQQAMAAEDRGDLEQAEALLSKFRAAHPGIFAVDESLGLLYVQRQDYARALPLLEAATHEDSASDVAHANLGAALYQLHRNQMAAAEFERAVQLNPANGQAQQSLGRVLMEMHKPADAAKALTSALALNPGDADLQLDCATALLAADRLEEAKRILSAFAAAENSSRAQSLLGELEEKRDSYHAAAEHYARAVQLEPSEENQWRLGVEFLRHWTFDAATRIFQGASAQFPQSVRLRTGLGAALFGDAQYAQAIPVFAGLLESEPDNAEYAGMLGVSCTTVMQEARPQCAVLVHYAETHPKDARASAYAAAFLLDQSDSQSQRPLARKLLDAALAADPKLPEAQFRMGKFLQDDQMWKESIPYLECAVELKPDYSTAHYRLARAYWRTGRKQDGDAQIELQKKFSRQEAEDLDRRLRQITRFVTENH